MQTCEARLSPKFGIQCEILVTKINNERYAEIRKYYIVEQLQTERH